MNAHIHSVDTQKPDSEGHNLYVRRGQLEVAVRRIEGLPLGEHKDQHYLELRASSWEDATHSTLTAQLNAEELHQLFEAALEAELIDAPVSRRLLKLLEQLREELAVIGRKQNPDRPTSPA